MKRSMKEQTVEKALCCWLERKGVKYQRQVNIPLGRVDVLTKSTLYEVKQHFGTDNCIKALGQLIFYGARLPGRELVMAAAGYCSPEYRQLLKTHGIRTKSLAIAAVEDGGEDDVA